MSGINNIRVRLAEVSRIMLTTVGWGVILASLALTGILQGLIVPHDPQYDVQSALPGIALYYIGILATCLLGGLLLRNVTTALLAFLTSYAIAIMLTSIALNLPGFLGYLPSVTAQNIALTYVFTAFFPGTLFVGLVGAVIGSVAREL